MHSIIIGKNSNLSIHLSAKLDNCVVVSARDVYSDINILSSFKDKKINIIFNNFQPAVELNSLTSSTQYINNSIVSTAKVLEYFEKSNINKIIYTSSSSVYGNNILCSEDDELKPMNLHASLKVANEKLIEKFSIEHKIDYTIARVFNMYGGDDNFSIISKIIKAVKNNEQITIVNNGNAIRDFIHIDDVVDVYTKLLEIKKLKIVNVGTGNGSSIKNILDFLHNNNINIRTKNIQREELKISTADNNLLLKYAHKNSFKNIEDYLVKELNI